MKVMVIFHCNEWQSYDSFRLIGVATKSNLKKALNKIKKVCNYTDDDMKTYIAVEEQELNNLREFDI